MQNKFEQENFYEFHLNKKNELMVSLKSRDDIPVSPLLIYDGGEHALFYRKKDQVILLDFIHPEIRPYLKETKVVLFSETQNYQVIRNYNVPCKMVTSLPIDINNVSNLLDKNEAKKVDDRDLYK